MSAYFESLNRRVSTPPVASAPAVATTPEPAVVRPAQPARVAGRRLAPGAVPSAYAVLRERLMMAAQGKTLKSLVFAGCDGGEGCTQVVREFAESLASAGLNVLLVDADIRTAGVTSSIAARGADLTELVRTKDVPPATPWGRGRLTVVPRPTALTDKETFLRSPDLAFWLDKQRVSYDYSFLDAPPILGHADGTLAGLLCDGVVLVVKGGVTRGDALARARQQIESAGGKALGVVLNQVHNPVPVFLRRYLASD
jgi:succinoglycan biosynthesis transport protein ExoP